MLLYVLRGAFILLAATVTTLYVLPFQEDQGVEFSQVVLMIGITLGVAGAIIAADIFSPRKKLSALSGVFLGLLAGLLAAYALSFVVDLIGLLLTPAEPDARQAFLNLLQGIKVYIGLVTCYVSISLVLQTKGDFRFVIPYFEFAKQIRGQRPTLLDSSVIIDGRVLDIARTLVLQGMLVVPRAVLEELHTISDSPDALKRARGRRGLDTLNKLQENPHVEVTLDDTDAEGGTTDQKLVNLAQHLRARLMTNDFNLSKVANLRGVEVINLNELAQAMRPVVLPGEPMRIKLIKPGENPHQGVGYLDDGTMVVVEHARQHVGQEIDATVTSTIQTAAGRMIFARCASPPTPPPARPHGPGRTGRHDKQP